MSNLTTPPWWQALEAEVSTETVLREIEPLAPKTTMRVGGAARFYAEPSSVKDLSVVVRSARAAQVPTFFLGRGSNLIVLDSGFDGLVIRLAGRTWQEITVTDNRLEAGAGARLKQVCAAAAKEGLSGFEFLEGIPGTIGGSLRMNAGAMGGWIFDLVETVTCLELDGTVATHALDFFSPAYRSCPELLERVALSSVLLSKERGEQPAIRSKIDSYATIRRGSQPREPSAGCVFKNPENGYAGKLIEELGLKGASVGGAQVSAMHGNFIINTGGATAEDVIQLIRRIRARALNDAGVVLEPEALLLGADWEEALS